MVEQKSMHHRRHRDFEAFDKITLEVVPRYKTSGLSGDEWRISVAIKFWFKGEVVHTSSARDMASALLLLGREFLEHQSPLPMRVIELERSGKCDQPGCDADSVSRYRFKRLCSARGEYLHDDENKYSDSYAQFCKRHLRRGDCGREDADDNYEVISGPGPDGSSNVIESPSAFGGVVEVELDAD